jgi:hypothetical protein
VSKVISEERKGAYLLGGIIIGVGIFLFLMQFVVIATSINNSRKAFNQPLGDMPGSTGYTFDNNGNIHQITPRNNFSSDSSIPNFGFGIIGFILIIAGSFVRGTAEKGVAGSGLVLDPEQAREDLEPFSRQAGGMLKDALDEADVHIGSADTDNKVIMIRCRKCSGLNPESAKFCNECGDKL